MRKSLILLLTLCTVFLLIGLLPVHGETEIYDNVLRLHILANSDSEEDQALKIKVRDSVLAASTDLFSGISSREEALTVLEANRDRMERAAAETIAREGYSYPVELKLGEEHYPARSYGSICFPSGTYVSLQIRIGEAKGQNWWCVLFPPLCLSAAGKAQNNEDAFISVGLTKDQYRVITETDNPPYTVRFKLLEVIEKAHDGT